MIYSEGYEQPTGVRLNMNSQIGLEVEQSGLRSGLRLEFEQSGLGLKFDSHCISS